LLVFVLLLANMAQLQPGVAAEGQALFSKLSPALAELQRFRTPSVWVSSWAGRELWHYLAVVTLGVRAAVRIWSVLPRSMRWLVAGTGAVGFAAVPFSYLLLDRLHYAVVAEWQPSKVLVLIMALSALLLGLAGMRAVLLQRRWEAFGWCVLLLILPLTPSISEPGRAPQELTQIRELAAWADRDTWGSSMFLFPDAAKTSDPAIFRAQARRAVWADWASGVAVDYSEANGLEWRSRWGMTMEGQFSPARLQSFLALPIDYYVLKRQNQIAGVRAVFTNDEFTVYDAQDLRNAPGGLRLAR
jgi:hypothetical protein